MRYLGLLALVILTSTVWAKPSAPITIDRFEYKTIIEVEGITTPKVVQFNTNESLGAFQSLRDLSTGGLIPHRVGSTSDLAVPVTPVVETSALQSGSKYQLFDKDYDTTGAVFAAQNTVHRVVISTEVSSIYNGLKMTLAEGVFRPKKISIEIDYGDGEFVNFIDQIDYQNTLDFAAISPERVAISFDSPHYFALNEIQLMNKNLDQESRQIIFYATEGGRYELFSNPAAGQKRLYSGSTLPLRTEKETPVFDLPALVVNPAFNPDLDRDGLVDTEDLCPSVIDASNADVDNDGRGDVCQDPDQDSHLSYKDNCPFVYNRDQADIDVDGVGDACDVTDERFTENMSRWVLNVVFMLIAFMLLGLVVMSVRRQTRTED